MIKLSELFSICCVPMYDAESGELIDAQASMQPKRVVNIELCFVQAGTKQMPALRIYTERE